MATGVPSVRGVIAATADSIWLLTDDKTTLARIDPDQNLVVGELRVPAGCRSLMFGETALWLACPAGEQSSAHQPGHQSGRSSRSRFPPNRMRLLPARDRSGRCAARKEKSIASIPKTNKVSKTIELGVPGADGEIAFGDGFIWVTQTGFPLSRIDVATETVAATVLRRRRRRDRGIAGRDLAVQPESGNPLAHRPKARDRYASGIRRLRMQKTICSLLACLALASF